MADVDVRVTTTGIPEAKQGVAELTAATTKLSDGEKKQVQNLVSALSDIEDVQKVYTSLDDETNLS